MDKNIEFHKIQQTLIYTVLPRTQIMAGLVLMPGLV